MWKDDGNRKMKVKMKCKWKITQKWKDTKRQLEGMKGGMSESSKEMREKLLFFQVNKR